jgi:arginyl-tRNA--protein-N-Asp/Glu arginylyltransferase
MTGPRPRLLLGAEHRCSYLPGRAARSVFVDPQLPLDAARYGQLLALGFRRSGGYVYRPACGACQECRPARLPAAEFRPDRSQRRCLKRNAALQAQVERDLNAEHYALYRRYLYARHNDGGMDPEDREAFRSFLSSAWGYTEIVSVRDRSGRLLAGGVIDRVPQALSAVYTYFEPDEADRSLGTYVILKEIERAQALKLPHLYLGYWVPGSAKMDYKKHFRPLELLTDGGWQREDGIAPGTAIPDNARPDST